MSGRDLFCQPRRFGRGAALTLVFTSVLAAGAATGSFDTTGRKNTSPSARSAPAGHQEDVADAAAEAMADGKSPVEAAERAVSRSGDRWGAVYSQGEYEEFEEALDGQYTGVGLWARRERDGRIEVSRVQSGSPAQAAGIRKGDRLRSVDGRRVDGRPVTEVVSLLRGDATDATAGTTVALGLERGTRAWSETLRRARLSTDSVTVRELPGGVTVIKVAAFTKGSGDRVRTAVRPTPPPPGSSSTCAGTPAAWSPRPSPVPPPSSTAASSPRTT
jgi:carboxyl-terminal processing protease